ncbi:hypothetical protein ZWY2020_019692 [Hordeum vulgare]|nr:hypothetical protein ZWY2020_019692 [Hordeum vulgare]
MPQVAVKEEQGRRPAKTATLENQLQKELQQHLKGKRYFLLFDDIWSASAWEIIRNCLPADELIRRKIVRAVEHSSNGKVKTCQVHDMVLEYIISKSSEENFIIRSWWALADANAKEQGCKGFKKHHVKAISKMLLVKFLNLRRTDIKELPSKIGRLKHLETLDIRETNVRELPDSIA